MWTWLSCSRSRGDRWRSRDRLVAARGCEHSSRRDDTRRRLVAMIFSPLIQLIWFGVLIENDPLAAFVFGILAPAGSAFVVQLRERTRVSSEPTSF